MVATEKATVTAAAAAATTTTTTATEKSHGHKDELIKWIKYKKYQS